MGERFQEMDRTAAVLYRRGLQHDLTGLRGLRRLPKLRTSKATNNAAPCLFQRGDAADQTILETGGLVAVPLHASARAIGPEVSDEAGMGPYPCCLALASHSDSTGMIQRLGLDYFVNDVLHPIGWNEILDQGLLMVILASQGELRFLPTACAPGDRTSANQFGSNAIRPMLDPRQLAASPSTSAARGHRHPMSRSDSGSSRRCNCQRWLGYSARAR